MKKVMLVTAGELFSLAFFNAISVPCDAASGADKEREAEQRSRCDKHDLFHRYSLSSALLRANEPCNFFMSGKPDSRFRTHVFQQSLEHRNARAMPNHVRMHREYEHRSFLISLVELRAPDGEDLIGCRVWPQSS